MSNDVLYGEVVSVVIVVHELPPDGRRWNATEPRPEPPVSLAGLVSVTVWRRIAPGSSCALAGAFVSDLTSLPDVAVLQLPALSATRKRYTAQWPDVTESGLDADVQPEYDEQLLFARLPVWRSSVAVDAFTSASGPLFVVIPNEPAT